VTRRRFHTVNVFSQGRLDGNPVAVIVDGDGMTTEEMQQLTRWTNLSEATFLLTPTDPAADYRVRIFTLDREMPFAGHPTLGSCHAWLESGGVPRTPGLVHQECGAGLVAIRRTDEGLAFAAPPLIRDEPVQPADLDRFATALRIAPDRIVDSRWADNGPGWAVLLLDSAQTVLDLEPVPTSATRLDIGVVGPHPAGSDSSWELRAFYTDHLGILREDPVTGSLNAAVAHWLFTTGRAAGAYLATQGKRVQRNGRIHLRHDDDGTVWVGGHTQSVLIGHADL